MNAEQVLMQGTLRPDGTVVLTQAPPLRAGPVEVLIRVVPESSSPGETWWEYLQQARAELLEKGQSFRSKEAIDADRAQARCHDEERRQAIQRMQSLSE